MDQKRLYALLIVIVPQIVEQIASCHQLNVVEATRRFYRSKVFKLLEREETKVWHFSPTALFRLFEEEYRFGNFTLPEEV